METYDNNQIEKIEIDKKFFLFNWHMTGWCNYHCPFCIAAHLQTKWIPEEKIIEYAKGINEFINKNLSDKKIAFKLIGGEVTYYDLPKVLDNIDHIDKIVLVTNLSREVEYFYKLEDYCKERNIQFILICSLHDENDDFENKFLAITEWCRKKREEYKYKFYKDPQLTLVVTEDFDKSVVEHYRSLGIWRIRLTRVRLQTQVNAELPEETLNYIWDYNQYYEEKAGHKGQTYQITLKDGSVKNFICASNFTNYLSEGGFIPDNFYCTAGVDSIAILPNGDVTLARCDYLLNNIIGNITNPDDIILPKNPILCKLNEQYGESKKRCDLCAGTNLYRAK